MTKNSKRKGQKDIKRCIYCGRIVDNKDVVCSPHTIEYIKKLGYKVIDPVSKTEL